MERILLHKDTEGLARRERMTADLNERAISLLKRFETATGQKNVSLSHILDNGTQSILESFYKTNAYLFPKNVNKAMMFEVSTGLSLKAIADEISTLKGLLESGEWNFKITEMNTISPKANSSIFNKYLDESKQKDYDNAVKLLEVAREIKKDNSYSGMLHIKRFAPQQWFMSTGLDLEINISYFSKY